MRFTRVALAFFLVLAAALAIRAFWLEPRSLVVREVSLELNEWSLGAPLRVAVLTDFHVGSPFNGLAKVERAVKEANRRNPHLAVLLGDYVVQDVPGGRFVPPERIAPVLSRLDAPLGTFAVLGNHDWWLDAPRVRRAFESNGLNVIDDSAKRLHTAGGSFWLVGVSDYWNGPHDIAAALSAVRDDKPAIVITHNPDIFPEIPRRVMLTLAGHTHGGQVALPLLGRPVVPSRYGQRYAYGHVVDQGKHLFVSSGIGMSIIPIRFRVPPEIVLLTISGPRRRN